MLRFSEAFNSRCQFVRDMTSADFISSCMMKKEVTILFLIENFLRDVRGNQPVGHHQIYLEP